MAAKKEGQDVLADFLAAAVGCADNRPFLRCLHGYGLCLWRFGRFREAEKALTRMLWPNPTDNQGARFELYDVKEGKVRHE